VSGEALDHSDLVRERARFLSRIELFRGLSHEAQDRLAASVVERSVVSGEAVLVEYGAPGTELFVVKEGTLELVHNETTSRRDHRWRGVRSPDATDRSPPGVHDARSRGFDALLHPHGHRP
jgi:hypothetical protein